ncbi:MAG: hypothetical protein LBV67_08630 [Streptococcaceae bacterium]|jgi:hypothetical protein|nr:hypothetical protein [Streptococcaceae bacterium]
MYKFNQDDLNVIDIHELIEEVKQIHELISNSDARSGVKELLVKGILYHHSIIDGHSSFWLEFVPEYQKSIFGETDEEDFEDWFDYLTALNYIDVHFVENKDIYEAMKETVYKNKLFDVKLTISYEIDGEISQETLYKWEVEEVDVKDLCTAVWNEYKDGVKAVFDFLPDSVEDSISRHL